MAEAKKAKRSHRKLSGPIALAAGVAQRPVEAKYQPVLTKLKKYESWYDLHDFLRSVTAAEDDGLERIESKDSKARPPAFPSEGTLKLLKGIVFKPDHPYRTKLGYFTAALTSGGGAVNLQFGVSSLGSAQEWSSIDNLFDEFFVHSMTIHFAPYNVLGGSMPVGHSAGAAYDMGLGTPSNGVQMNMGLVVCSLFHGATGYTTANGMLCNPTKMICHSAHPWSYTWRNNVKFRARDPALSGATSESWQGWTLIPNVANYGGLVQVRTFFDDLIGDLTHAYDLGRNSVVWDVSFRARA